MRKEKLKIGIVGPCSAGKSTLANGLKKLGYEVRHIAQEHSQVPDMWKRLGNPDILVYLDISYEESMKRRPLNMSPGEFDEQVRRLEDAYERADVNIDTDGLSPEEVLEEVREFLMIKTGRKGAAS